MTLGTEVTGAPILLEALAENAHSSIDEVKSMFTHNPDLTVPEFVTDFTDVK